MKKLKALIVNGSPRAKGCSSTIIKHEKNKNKRYRNENVSLDEIIKSNFQDRRKSYEQFCF